MARPIQAAATDVTLYFLAVDIATGAVVTAGIAHDAAGLEIAYTRLREETVKAVVGDTPAPASLASDTATHTNWGWRHVGNGLHRADFPDAAFVSGSAGVICMPKLTGYQFIQVDPNLIMAVDPVADPTNEIVDAVRDDAIAMLEEGMTLNDTQWQLQDSQGNTVTITISRVARNAIASTAATP